VATTATNRRRPTQGDAKNKKSTQSTIIATWKIGMRSRVSSVVVEETAVLPKTVHELAAVGDLDGIRKLLASAEIGCDTTDDFGNTLLHVAASRGYLLVVRELVQV
jgi:hypothetical protein